jgi:hypothetical protein
MKAIFKMFSYHLWVCKFDRVELSVSFKKLILIIVVSFISPSQASWKSESFFQVVHLHKFDNTIVQGFIHAQKPWAQGEFYLGAWIDQDQKTGMKEVYTDAQVAPLVGFRSQVLASKWLPSRWFAEGRALLRTEDFPDQRARGDWELRFGLLGYDLLEKQKFFLEHYYAAFYTRLYGDRVIFQGWSRQGISYKSFDLFHEFFLDTFDFTRDQDATFDLRPGIRWSYRKEAMTLQLIHQYLHHLSNLKFAGRNEHRTSLVFARQW